MIRTLLLISLLTTGCMAPMMGPQSRDMGSMQMPDMDRMDKKNELMQKIMSNPQVPEWHEQREKLTLAMGDKVFDKDFDRVFDSLTIAVASLEANVNNMERQSGYITSAVPRMNPTRAKQIHDAHMKDLCTYLGYDPSLLEKKGPYEMDLDSFGGMMQINQQAMTISLVKQGPSKTKVKVRFSNVNYPAEVAELYKTVWPAIDKQIFMDKAID
jgi:hypothetical protein